MALHCGAMGLSAVCDCGISISYLLTIFISRSGLCFGLSWIQIFFNISNNQRVKWLLNKWFCRLCQRTPSIIETGNSVPWNRKQRKPAWRAVSFYLILSFIICSWATTDIKVHCQGIHFNVVYLYCILCVDIALFTQSYRCLVLAGKCSCRKKQSLN